jgi:lactose/L-arabinose transport system substrate-binding protein
MKAKKILAALLSAVLVLSFAACSSANDTSPASGAGTSPASTGAPASSTGAPENTSGSVSDKITIWAWDDNFNVKAANIAKEYYAKVNPNVQVEVVSMAQADIITKLNTAFSAPNYDGLPNIVLIEDYRIQNYLKSFPGELRDLSSIVDSGKFMDYKLKPMTDDGKIYGVPFDSGVAALFYRTDYIEQAGYTAADMQNLTWDKYIEIGKAVKQKTGKSMLTLDPSDLGQIRIMMQSAGSWYVKEDGKTVDIAGNTALKQAVNTYKKIIDADISTQVSGWDPFVSAFQKGDVASVPTGCWIAPTISAAEDQKNKWAVAPIPRMAENSNSVNSSNIGGASWYVIDKVKGADTAIDFLKNTFASNDELMNELVEEINLVSTLKSAGSMDNYLKASDFFSGQKIFVDFSDWTQKIPAVNYGLYTYDIEKIMTEALQNILQGANVDETFDNTQTQVEAALTN